MLFLFCQSACHLGRLTYPPNSLILICVKISNLSVKMSAWQTERERILALPLTEKRKLYKSKEYVKLNEIPTWQEYSRKETLAEPIPAKDDAAINISLNSTLCKKISIFRGDITTLEIDVIVNAANKTLRGGGGVDGAIHRAAGPLLLEECKSLGGCDTGHVKVTGGYQLPAKFVFHTVGPQGEKPGFLRQCYRNSLQLLAEKKLRSIAFPCISTGIYGFPNMAAAHIAVYEIRKHLEQFRDVDRIIFCIFMEEDLTIYQGILQSYFPVS